MSKRSEEIYLHCSLYGKIVKCENQRDYLIEQIHSKKAFLKKTLYFIPNKSIEKVYNNVLFRGKKSIGFNSTFPYKFKITLSDILYSRTDTDVLYYKTENLKKKYKKVFNKEKVFNDDFNLSYSLNNFSENDYKIFIKFVKNLLECMISCKNFIISARNFNEYINDFDEEIKYYQNVLIKLKNSLM